MTTTPNPVGTGAGRRPGRTGAASRAWVGTGVLTLTLAALAAGGWWLRHPSDVRWTETEMRPVLARGLAVWAPLYAAGPDQVERRSVTVESLAPVVASGQVDVEYFICTRGRGSLGVGFGVSTSYVDRTCRDLVPADGAALDLGETSREELVMSLTPRGPTPVRVSGHEVVFRDGWQTGHEVIAFDVEFTRSR